MSARPPPHATYPRKPIQDGSGSTEGENNPPIRRLAVSGPVSLAETCGPVAWSGSHWPHTGWSEGEFVCVAWEPEDPAGNGGRQRVVWRAVRALEPGVLALRGSADPAGDGAWAARTLGLDQRCPAFADPVVEALRRRYAGLRPLAEGALFGGLVTAIVGQSISVAAAASSTLSTSLRSRPAANAWRKAASENATVRPISFAKVAARIATSELPGNGSGQRIGGRP